MYVSVLSVHLLVIPPILLPFLGCYDQCCNAYSLQILLNTGLDNMTLLFFFLAEDFHTALDHDYTNLYFYQ